LPKLTYTSLASLTNESSAVTTINANFLAVQTALEKTLSRDGTSPNTMTAPIDMNSNRVVNLPLPVSSTEPVRKYDLEQALMGNIALEALVGVLYSRAAATTSSVPSTITRLVIYGDGNGGGYIHGTANGPMAFEDSNGTWWELDLSLGFASVKWFGAKGDNSTDDSDAITDAKEHCAGVCELWFPAGTYICKEIDPETGMTWKGEGMDLTILKLKAGANTGILTHGGSNADNVIIKDMTFDGNYTNNTGLGSTLVHIEGHKPELDSIRFQYVAGTALYTDYQIDGLWVGGALGRFTNLVFDTVKANGWLLCSPNDSTLEQIYMVDIGIGAHNTYDGLHIKLSAYGTSGGNCRVNGFHHNNRNGTLAVARYGFFIDDPVSGVTCTNSHFEGAVCPLYIEGSSNVFSSCAWYAPRGDYAVIIAGAGGNMLQGFLSNYGASSNLDFKGIKIQGSGQNMLDIFTGGPTEGNIEFSSSAGFNVVRMIGNSAGGTPLYLGTPHATDDVFINISGPSPGLFVQRVNSPWTAYTPTVTSAGGALTGHNVPATGRYKQDGKTVYLQQQVTVTSKGSGSPTGAINLTIPSGMTLAANQAGSCVNFNDGTSGGTYGSAGGTTIGYLKSDGTTYWVDGNSLVMTAVIEVA
jgi:hypothetical protein